MISSLSFLLAVSGVLVTPEPTYKVAVAFYSPLTKRVVLPALSSSEGKISHFPATEQQLLELFPERDFALRDAGDGVCMVVDKRCSLVESEVHAAVLMKELAKRSDPFAPLALSSLSEEARRAAKIVLFQSTTPVRVNEGIRKLDDCFIMLEPGFYSTHVESGKPFGWLELQRSPASRQNRNQQLVDNAVVTGPTTQEMKDQMSTLFSSSSGVVVRHYGGDGFYPAQYMATASKALVKYVDEVRALQAEAYDEMKLVMQQLYEEYLGNFLESQVHSVLSSSSPAIAGYKGSFRGSWRALKFASQEDADNFLAADDRFRFRPLFQLKVAVHSLDHGSTSITGSEIFRF
ncbi:MAG: hypothetical protein KJZ62_00755 [Fimbriimonadaceae bacterium]|nr:hypothetical protein [Fimbriimonadaceae bacterium]QOJ11354.1 MAG: hypothetical protein HRU74_04545 [Chthonomonadaceae bacterium]